MSISRRNFIKGATVAALISDFTSVREAAAITSERHALESANRRGLRIVREDYSLDPSVTYLNHASIGTIPRVVQEAHAGYLKLCESNPWLYMWSDPWREPIDQVRSKAANLLRCDLDEIAILHNTTECFNTLAAGLPLGKGDEVLFCSLNHGGASHCWTNQSVSRGFSVRRFDFPIANIARLSKEDIVNRYEDELGASTRVIVLPHIDNTIGLRHPLKEITAMARDKGVRWVVVDGAQSAGMIPVDMKRFGVDVYATSAHKWIQSPKGLGVAYFSQEIQEVLRPMWVTWGQASWHGTARKYEDYGTRALSSYLALGDALDYQARTHEHDRVNHHRMMWESMRVLCEQNEHLIWRSTTDWDLSAAIYAIEIRGKKSSDVASRLFDEHGIVVRAFSSSEINAVRISPNLMNNPDELELFAQLTAA